MYVKRDAVMRTTTQCPTPEETPGTVFAGSAPPEFASTGAVEGRFNPGDQLVVHRIDLGDQGADDEVNRLAREWAAPRLRRCWKTAREGLRRRGEHRLPDPSRPVTAWTAS